MFANYQTAQSWTKSEIANGAGGKNEARGKLEESGGQ